MKLYKVTLGGNTRYVGTEADAKAAKRDLLEAENLGPRSSEAKIEPIEVPTDKKGLLAYLNGAR